MARSFQVLIFSHRLNNQGREEEMARSVYCPQLRLDPRSPSNGQDSLCLKISPHLTDFYLYHWSHLSNESSGSGHDFWPQGAYSVFPTLADFSELNF